MHYRIQKGRWGREKQYTIGYINNMEKEGNKEHKKEKKKRFILLLFLNLTKSNMFHL